ncbi:L-glutamate gamma-semialdehyde dehydrogenase [Staphylococcus auricularis]|uniref:L-glutamate gamma-semialdehyde dehydrogenase n=1 Tax=Staphylococcus auricularis TaxID=29379 RepID=A0ABX5IH99_9STAP|nr:L-glutamate gamma-semialdehyde dehydrogenase [Staphylococcus auricularis]MCE5037640.1 L-glutamate gamma-semialdehyde dehydrogenase [Staphylococcus auricularis]MEB6569839.1 L-glutamate gamma-semialdehyde dehydrogenase [Staphylococcus auricularis]PTH19208.1 L-glutamate gamma-semialdehyde dehydrogenase [Staphylococcus auricularis]PTH26248.1 L-glutamate gamma-semialdehyde dehydrogenase [Staphylococcus auricularis]
MIPYKHEPFTDFTQQSNVDAYQQAIEKVESELGKTYPLIINGERIYTDDTTRSYNPSDREETIGYVSKATQEHAQQAVEAAKEAFKTWRNVDPEVRANILFRAAAITRRRKHEFSALLTKEGGKPWKEADADTAEAIDFMEYYGREMLRLKDGKKVESRPGEYNQYDYLPIGVSVVISPWNFAYAIMAGTTVAPVVTGNTVLLKPSSNTPVISYKFMEVLEEAGLPKGVVNWIPGSSADIGNYLVEHKDVGLISFTGSKRVGTDIMQRASKIQEGQNHMKRVIAEMGGKDTIVVDDEANLDTATDAIVNSAFGFSGQKCSACSRVIAVESIYDELLDRVKAATEKLTVGNAADHNNFMGPVIDEKSLNKIKDYLEIGEEEGRLVTGGKVDESTGNFVYPTIFGDLAHDSRVMQEEIFGPVVGFSKAKDFDQAIEYANDTEYGLTGAVISNNRMKLEQARRDFLVGNLYFNRGCTGAVVGYQPFGGFKMSGTDSKAGGPDYLVLHMQGRTVSEHL